MPLGRSHYKSAPRAEWLTVDRTPDTSRITLVFKLFGARFFVGKASLRPPFVPLPTHQSLELELELGEQPTTADPAQAQDDASPTRTPPSSLRGGGGRKVRIRRVRHHHIFPRGRPTCGLRFAGGGASRFPGLVLALRVGRAPAVEDMAEERPRMINWRPRECSRGRGKL